MEPWKGCLGLAGGESLWFLGPLILLKYSGSNIIGSHLVVYGSASPCWPEWEQMRLEVMTTGTVRSNQGSQGPKKDQ